MNFWMSSSSPEPASFDHCLGSTSYVAELFYQSSKYLMSFSNWTMSVVGVIRMSKVSSNLMEGFSQESGQRFDLHYILVWNNIGLDSSIHYGEIDRGNISKRLAGVRL